MCGNCGQSDKGDKETNIQPGQEFKQPGNDVEPDSTSRRARVGLVNKSNTAMYNIVLIHQYSNCTLEHFSWDFLAPHKSTNDDLLCHYETGAGTGYDYWSIMFQVDGGTGYYVMNKQCYLTSADDYDNGGALWFRVLDSTFYMDTRSSSCSAGMTKTAAPPS